MPVIVTEKRCTACNRILPRTAFYRSSRNADGILARCKECQRRERGYTKRLRVWTSTEDAILKRELQNGGDWKRRTAEILERDSGGVYCRGRLLIKRGEISAELFARHHLSPAAAQAWTQMEIVHLKALAKDGLTIREIAQQLNRTVYAVGGKANRLGLDLHSDRGMRVQRSQKNHWAAWEEAELRDGCAAGLSVPLIATLLGRSLASVRSKVNRLELITRKRLWTAEETMRLRLLVLSGKSDAELAIALNRSRNAVRIRRLRTMNVG